MHIVPEIKVVVPLCEATRAKDAAWVSILTVTILFSPVDFFLNNGKSRLHRFSAFQEEITQLHGASLHFLFT